MIYHKKLDVWLYPGGHVEPGETPAEAVVREFEEETGLRVEPVGPRLGITAPDVIEEPLPFAIMREVVRYPSEVHLHYDLIFLVERTGGTLREGRWISADDLDVLKTYPNVRELVRRALGARKP
ncbi:mutT/nudix family protein [Thermoproteus tenax Kra 1]|uniref:MutT/nudix family protein n=2 Tax=Thermoproteus tenax TaxID=2271 RepID=G4RQ15_THETK|nr:mutT/nudix family protein [Thermoproteus tenax Kra 1]